VSKKLRAVLGLYPGLTKHPLDDTPPLRRQSGTTRICYAMMQAFQNQKTTSKELNSPAETQTYLSELMCKKPMEVGGNSCHIMYSTILVAYYATKQYSVSLSFKYFATESVKDLDS
jgi:hypothetical protein